MRIFFFLIVLTFGLYAKNYNIVLVDSKGISFDMQTKEELQKLFLAQKPYLDKEDTLSVFLDNEKVIKNIYLTRGAAGIIKYAQSKRYHSITLVEYRKGSRNLSFLTIVSDEKVQDRKSKSLPFTPTSSKELLAKTIMSYTFMLNYELGLLDEKTVY